MSTNNLNAEPWFEAASKEARFVELVKGDLRNTIYETTDYFGPMSTIEILALKPFFRLKAGFSPIERSTNNVCRGATLHLRITRSDSKQRDSATLTRGSALRK